MARVVRGICFTLIWARMWRGVRDHVKSVDGGPGGRKMFCVAELTRWHQLASPFVGRTPTGQQCWLNGETGFCTVRSSLLAWAVVTISQPVQANRVVTFYAGFLATGHSNADAPSALGPGRGRRAMAALGKETYLSHCGCSSSHLTFLVLHGLCDGGEH